MLRTIVIRLWAIVELSMAFMSVGEAGSFIVTRRVSPMVPDPRSQVSLYQGQPWAPNYWREAKSLRIEYKPYVVWRESPYEAHMIAFDEDGLRRTLHSHCQGRGYTIWMFGGSTLLGQGSPDLGTIPSLLAAEYEKAGRPACVVDFGQDAWVNTQELIALLLTLKTSARLPDLVIFYDGINDTNVAGRTGRTDVHENYESIKQHFAGWAEVPRGTFAYLQETNLAQVGRKALERLQRSRGRAQVHPGAGNDRLPRAILANYFENMRAVQALSHEFGFKFVAFWQPALFAEHKPLTAEERAISKRYAMLFPEVATLYPPTYALMRAERRPLIFYIADVFNDQSKGIYIDFAHVGPEGNRLIAARLHGILVAHGL